MYHEGISQFLRIHFEMEFYKKCQKAAAESCGALILLLKEHKILALETKRGLAVYAIGNQKIEG